MFVYGDGSRCVVITARHKPSILAQVGHVGSLCPKREDVHARCGEITRRAIRYVQDRAKQKQPFFLYFSLTSPHEPVVPSKDFRGRSGIAPIADFVMETDWSAGQVIEAIDEAGLAEDSLSFLPALMGGIFWRGATRLGALCGLGTGFVLWVFTMLLPSFGVDAALY